VSMFKWKKKSIWIILNATPLLYRLLVTGEYTAPYHSPSFLLMTNATRRQKEVVNLRGLFASHRELAKQKEKKTSREMVRLQSWMCPGEMTDGMTCGSINKNLQVDESTVSKRLKGLGMIQKQGHWVPYELKPRDVERRFGTCELLLQRQKRTGFLKSAAEAHRILVQTYGDNALSDTTCRDWFRRFKNNDFELEDKERSGAPKKFQDKELEQLLDEKYYRYRLQLMRLSRALKEKRPLYAQRYDKVILLHDNARPHVAKPVKTYLETLKWEVLPHPPYSPDIAPSDFHLFRSMAHGPADRRFHSYEEAQKWIDSWIASKDMSFFRRGIHVLPERWSKVVESDGKYFH
ncbi:MOS1T transposase, partial [Pseudoatta argentina]